MFLRFITQYIDEDNEIQTGVFQATGFLIRSSATFEHDKKRLEIIRSWFNYYLEKPDRFTKSKSKNPPNVAISWFKSSSIEHLKRMYDMKEVLEKYDIVVDVVKRANPGYIVYEDEYQVSTVPHRHDKNKVK